MSKKKGRVREWVEERKRKGEKEGGKEGKGLKKEKKEGRTGKTAFFPMGKSLNMHLYSFFKYKKRIFKCPIWKSAQPFGMHRNTQIKTTIKHHYICKISYNLLKKRQYQVLAWHRYAVISYTTDESINWYNHFGKLLGRIYCS